MRKQQFLIIFYHLNLFLSPGVMEVVNLVRQHEADIIKDIKFSNSLLAIRKLVKENDSNMQLKIAALHSMRRIFVHFLDNITELIAKETSDKMTQFKAWYVKQYYLYVDELKAYSSIAASSNDELLLQAPAVRTFLEVSLIFGILLLFSFAHHYCSLLYHYV
jgi:hypothetical protein